jgi:integrase
VQSLSCEGPDGRIRFSLKKRAGSPFYFVTFRDPAGRWRELTTGEKAKHAAEDAAKPLVLDAMTPHGATVVWADAMTLLKEHAQAKNLRPATIQQYELVVNTLKKLFPDTRGPADITPETAQTFAVKRMKAKKGEKQLSPRTVAGNIDNLSIVFGCWFRDTLKIIKGNPFDTVKPPKVEKKPPRVITAEEQKALADWLAARWKGWRLPILFLEVKAAIGCRIAELASAATAGLKDGRIMFASETTKGRKQRACRLPAALFTELQAIAGPIFVFQRFADELRAIHLRRGRPNHAKGVTAFRPDRLVDWLQDQAAAYFKASGALRFKLHNLRGTAMSKARMAGVAESDAAIAFGCNAGTMRAAYLALDEEKIADDVFAKMQGAGAGT